MALSLADEILISFYPDAATLGVVGGGFAAFLLLAALTTDLGFAGGFAGVSSLGGGAGFLTPPRVAMSCCLFLAAYLAAAHWVGHHQYLCFKCPYPWLGTGGVSPAFSLSAI